MDALALQSLGIYIVLEIKNVYRTIAISVKNPPSHC